METLKALEQKVAAAAGVITRLRTENTSLGEKAKKAEAEQKRLQQELDKLHGLAGTVKHMEQELKTLRDEREQVRGRISAMLEKLSALDDAEG